MITCLMIFAFLDDILVNYKYYLNSSINFISFSFVQGNGDYGDYDDDYGDYSQNLTEEELEKLQRK